MIFVVKQGFPWYGVEHDAKECALHEWLHCPLVGDGDGYIVAHIKGQREVILAECWL